MINEQLRLILIIIVSTSIFGFLVFIFVKNYIKNKINYLIKEKVIDIEPIKQDSIPEWLKMNGQKWLEGDITQKEYFDVIKFVSSE